MCCVGGFEQIRKTLFGQRKQVCVSMVIGDCQFEFEDLCDVDMLLCSPPLSTDLPRQLTLLEHHLSNVM